MRSSRQGAIPSPIGKLIDDLNAIERRLRILETPSGESLAATGPRLQALAEAAVSPANIRVMDGAAVFGGSAANFAEASVATPAGYTRALVTATAQASLRHTGTVGSWALLQVACLVADTGTQTSRLSIGGGQHGSASASNSALLSGLIEGDPVTASARVSFAGTSEVSTASTMGTVLFLR